MDRKIVFVSSEIFPFSKTGGLADVSGSLSVALRNAGVQVCVVTPFYGRLSTGGYKIKKIISDCPVGYPWPPITCDVYMADYQGVPVYFIARGEYFDRRYYYNDPKGDYFDNAERFIFFSRAVLSLLKLMGEAPEVIHCHDWQSALIPVYMHFLRRSDPFWSSTSTLLTIHNLAFQGRFSSRLFADSNLPTEAWQMEGIEYYGDLNFLKGGIAYADVVSTVSPTYASEILTKDFGCGLEGVLQRRQEDLAGVINGADYVVWNPRTDPFLPAPYTSENLKGKALCKRVLIKELGLSNRLENRPLLGFIGRLRGQKGIDLLNSIVPELMKLDVGVIVLGEGAKDHEERTMELTKRFAGSMAAVIGYTEELAHRILAGSDIFLMPSRYEPCGLTQMYALRYGAPPVATAVGGLCDTIIPWPEPSATGFTFALPDPESFLKAATDAVRLWTDNQEEWLQMTSRAMNRMFTWHQSCLDYIELYKKASGKVQGARTVDF